MSSPTARATYAWSGNNFRGAPTTLSEFTSTLINASTRGRRPDGVAIHAEYGRRRAERYASSDPGGWGVRNRRGRVIGGDDGEDGGESGEKGDRRDTPKQETTSVRALPDEPSELFGKRRGLERRVVEHALPNPLLEEVDQRLRRYRSILAR